MHRHLGRAAADVDDHRAGRLAHGQPRADRRRHGLLDQIGRARPRRQARLLDRALLDPRHPRRHAHDHARVRPAVLVDLLDEVPEHLLGHVEVRDHAVLERTDRLDRPGRASEHALGLDADRMHFPAARVDRHDARLREDDAPPADVHERVGRPQVDRHVAAAESCQIAEDAHIERGSTLKIRSGATASRGARRPALIGACPRGSLADSSRRPAHPPWIGRSGRAGGVGGAASSRGGRCYKCIYHRGGPCICIGYRRAKIEQLRSSRPHSLFTIAIPEQPGDPPAAPGRCRAASPAAGRPRSRSPPPRPAPAPRRRPGWRSRPPARATRRWPGTSRAGRPPARGT